MSQWSLIQPAMFYSPVGTGGTTLTCFFPMFSYRARQKLITKETAMPGESKALRPPRVVLRRGISLILCPPPLPRLRSEPLALPQTVSPAKLVREHNILTGVETIKVLV